MTKRPCARTSPLRCATPCSGSTRRRQLPSPGPKVRRSRLEAGHRSRRRQQRKRLRRLNPPWSRRRKICRISFSRRRASPLQTGHREPHREQFPSRRPQLSPTNHQRFPPLRPVSTASVALLKVPLRLVGVIGRLYIVLESDRGLVLMDQHAAHERILYEQMLRRLEQPDAPSQRLLLPETVEVSPRDAQFLREHLPVLGRLGVGLSEFGERTFLLDALPPFVKVPDARRFVLELIDELLGAGQEINSFRLGEQTVAKTVCRHAVKANDPLSGPELEKLIEDLRTCAMPYTCPHGRPTLLEMNYRELEKKFGRTQ